MPVTLPKKTGAPVPAASAGMTTTNKKGGEVASQVEEQLEPPAQSFEPNMDGTPWCTVGFKAGYTKNMQNYESAKIEVWISIPCPHSEVETVYLSAQKFVDDKLTAELAALA
jgi:hypothetical protein